MPHKHQRSDFYGALHQLLVEKRICPLFISNKPHSIGYSSNSLKFSFGSHAYTECASYGCFSAAQRRRQGGMPAPGPSPAGAAAAPVSGEDRMSDTGRPSADLAAHPPHPLFSQGSQQSPTSWPHQPGQHVTHAAPLHTTRNSSTRSLKIAHVNINSITAANRLDELHHFVRNNNIHVLALTETKLDDSIHPALYRLDNFHAPLTHHRNRHGGGTAIYAHKSLPITEIKPLELDNSEEWIWCKISTSKFSILICCLYLPPNLDSNRLDHFIENFSESVSLANTYPATTKIILGDFNAGNVYLKHTNQGLKSSGIDAFDSKLFDTAETLDLTQVIHEPTRITEECANLRDLIFVSNSEIVKDSGTLSSFSRLDHFPVYVELCIDTFEPSTLTKTIWDYERTDSDLLIRNLQQTDWDSIVKKDIHSAVSEFSHAVLSAAKIAIPTKQVHIKCKDKPWMNNELRRSIRRRDMLFKCAKRTQSKIDWQNWKQQRNIVTALNKRLRSEHIQSEVKKLIENKQNPYKYYQIISSLTGRKYAQPIPPLLKPDGETASDDKEKADLLNEFFASQTRLDSSSSKTFPTTQTQLVPTLDRIEATEREVLSILNSLNPNKSTGPDDIPTKLLKMCAILIVEPLTKLFNKSLQEGVFPDTWKSAIIKPIFKNKGSPSDPTNYDLYLS